MIQEVTLIFSGIAISSIVMAVGIGGGILWTPLLILAYKLSPQEAIGTAIFIQVIGLGSGSIAYFREKLIDIKLALLLVLVALPGIILGSLATLQFDQHKVQMALGVMAMILALRFVSNADDLSNDLHISTKRKQLKKIVPMPAFFGFLMGALSIGIGEWLIPALRSRLKMEMSEAIATSVFMTFLLATIASSTHWAANDNIKFEIFTWGAVGTAIGAQIGAKISRHINDRLLKQSFIYIMTLVGIHLIFQSI